MKLFTRQATAGKQDYWHRFLCSPFGIRSLSTKSLRGVNAGYAAVNNGGKDERSEIE